MIESERSVLERFVDDRPGAGEFSVHPDIFTDPELFELEMRNIFERTWVFLGLVNQAPKPHDFFTTWAGRQPVVVMRDGKGKLGAFFNVCRHRGSTLCHTERGTARTHVCSYHGWVYDSAGKNLDIKDRKHGCYPEAFDRQDHNLVPLAKFAEYRGFLFGSIAADVPSLDEHLGDMQKFLDLLVDQSPHGLELIPGRSVYTFRGNWKLQVENCADIYHLSSAHRNFMSIVNRRASGDSKHKLKSALDIGALQRSSAPRGSYTFKYGHTAIVGSYNPSPEARPVFAQIEEVRARVGEAKAKWMLGARNITIYPNVQFTDNLALQMRIIRPLAVDRTEMRISCLAPIGESESTREYRLRQFEDFFNATGMATPDDTTIYDNCQIGYGARQVGRLQGYSRGMTALSDEPDEYSREMEIRPDTAVTGPFNIGDETVFHSGYREWLRLMSKGDSQGDWRPVSVRRTVADEGAV